MKKIIFIIITIASLLIIKNFVVSIYDLWQKNNLVVEAQKELENEKKKNQNLKKDLAKAQSSKFIEQEARNKLLLVKEGEQKVIIPKELIASQAAKNEVVNNEPNWKKWLQLFFWCFFWILEMEMRYSWAWILEYLKFWRSRISRNP